MLILLFGLFGLIVGSFLNVVILRHGVRSIRGRSGCMSCGTQLKWHDMIPVLSWFLLRGRCRNCKAPISIQYPFVEATTGILFATLGFWFGSAPFGFHVVMMPIIIDYLCIISTLVAIAVYDLRHTIIPDAWAYTFAGLAFLSQFLMIDPVPSFTLFLFAGPIAAAPLFALWLFSHGRWMGLGDAKLALGIGWLLGPALGIFAVFSAFVIGAIVTLPLVFFSSRAWRTFLAGFTPTPISQRLVWGFTMKSEIPFGPFLILSCIIIWFASLYGLDPLQIFEGLLSLSF